MSSDKSTYTYSKNSNSNGFFGWFGFNKKTKVKTITKTTTTELGPISQSWTIPLIVISATAEIFVILKNSLLLLVVCGCFFFVLFRRYSHNQNVLKDKFQWKAETWIITANIEHKKRSSIQTCWKQFPSSFNLFCLDWIFLCSTNSRFRITMYYNEKEIFSFPHKKKSPFF